MRKLATLLIAVIVVLIVIAPLEVGMYFFKPKLQGFINHSSCRAIIVLVGLLAIGFSLLWIIRVAVRDHILPRLPDRHAKQEWQRRQDLRK